MKIEGGESKLIIQKVRDQLILSAEELRSKVEDVVDGYWMEWRLKNRKIAQIEAQKMAPIGCMQGNIAPRITVRTGKTYIEWLVFEPGRYGAREKNWGKRIAPRKGPVYKKEQFIRLAKSWELDLILETEDDLRPLRYALEKVHSTQVYLGRLLSKNVILIA